MACMAHRARRKPVAKAVVDVAPRQWAVTEEEARPAAGVKPPSALSELEVEEGYWGGERAVLGRGVTDPPSAARSGP